MRRHLAVALVLVSLVVAAPLAAGTSAGPAVDRQAGATAGASVNDTGGELGATQRDDPASDVIGWENGYWYDDQLNVDQSDGLNDSELDAVVARGMARVEQIRQLEFEEDVPVNIISREDYSEQVSGGAEPPADVALHQNVKFESLFMIGEDTSAIATQQSTLSASVLGYYSPSQNQIVIVSENTTSPKLDEITLSQELFHALQDQKFDAFRKPTPTREDHNAYDGVIEGDGNYVDYLYEQRCEAGWDCLLPQESGGGGGGDIHFGIYLLQFQPYSDDPAFVRDIREAGGWDAVNALYKNPPTSTEQVIHPEKYQTDEPVDVTVEDTSTDKWRIPDTGGVTYAKFGEAGIFSMFMYPSLEPGTPNEVILDLRGFVNYNSEGDVQTIDPYNYESEYSAGWDGDKLYPYVTEDSTETNETGYVWKLVWDSDQDAQEFVTGYEELLAYRGGEERADGLWVIPDGPYADAFFVRQEGDTVLVVNAPTVEELSEVRTDIDVPQVTEPTSTATETATGTTTATTDGTTTAGDDPTSTAAPTTTSGDSGPGFGPMIAAIGAVLALLLLRRVRD